VSGWYRAGSRLAWASPPQAHPFRGSGCQGTAVGRERQRRDEGRVCLEMEQFLAMFQAPELERAILVPASQGLPSGEIARLMTRAR